MRRTLSVVISGLLLVPAVLAITSAGRQGPGRDEQTPMILAGHGATCTDGLDNDRDGQADGMDPDDCFSVQEPGTGRPVDHEEDNGPEPAGAGDFNRVKDRFILAQ